MLEPSIRTCTQLQRTCVSLYCVFLLISDASNPPKPAHGDAVWGIQWTPKDQVISISADGGVKLWDSTSGQTVHERPPHTLGITSLSVSPSGKQALYNSVEGLTALWDLESGEVAGTKESYVRSSRNPSDPGSSNQTSHIACFY